MRLLTCIAIKTHRTDGICDIFGSLTTSYSFSHYKVIFYFYEGLNFKLNSEIFWLRCFRQEYSMNQYLYILNGCDGWAEITFEHVFNWTFYSKIKVNFNSFGYHLTWCCSNKNFYENDYSWFNDQNSKLKNYRLREAFSNPVNYLSFLITL